MLDSLRFHHAGVACTDIHRETETLSVVGYRPEGAEFVDVVQGVRGIFLAGQQPRLELLQPISDAKGVLTPWLKTSTKIYHLAYEANALQDAIAGLRDEGAKLVVAPVPAVAFNGRPIAFVMLRNRLLVEIIQSA